MLPVYLQSHDINRAWAIGAAAVIWTGHHQAGGAFPFAGVIRRVIPVPGLHGRFRRGHVQLSWVWRFCSAYSISRWSASSRSPLLPYACLANVPITRWRIPPFLVAWIVPLAIGVGIGYVHPVWHGFHFPGCPSRRSPARCTPWPRPLPYMSVIAPIAIYQVLQDIAAVEGAAAAGDDYDVRSVDALRRPREPWYAASQEAW